MDFKPHSVLQGMAGALMCLAFVAGAQTTTPPAPASTTAPDATKPTDAAAAAAAAPATPPAAPTWSIGKVDFSGAVDGYYSYNANRPSNSSDGQINTFYNFNDKTDQFNLSLVKLSLNHDPDPVGVHVDLVWGRTNTLIHNSNDASTTNYIEQAFLSVKPTKGAHGTEFDFGQFVTSAGAEVIEAKDNWNYSRSLLFALAIPYYHFGVRTSTPFTKSWTAGVQVVNGWNNVVDDNGGVTIGLTSAYTKPKFTWSWNYYTGPENFDTQKGYRNLFDTTLLLTPSAKFSAYINYDYGQNHSPALSAVFDESPAIRAMSFHWQGIAAAARAQITPLSALAARYEYYYDQGFTTGTKQHINEFTATYEHKCATGIMMRTEYRRDWSDSKVFEKGDTNSVKAQSTFSVALLAFFGPSR